MFRMARVVAVLLCSCALAGADMTAGPLAFATDPADNDTQLGVPAYVYPGEPMDVDLAAATDPAGIVIINPGNGDEPFGPAWQAQADALRAEGTEVIGYVHTDYTHRAIGDVEASVDNYLKTADARLHVDGIFFDETTSDCGSAPGLTDYRDYYLDLENYVWNTMESIQPGVDTTVVDNAGEPVDSCYIAGYDRTADTFVTFEGDYQSYLASAGDNVINPNGPAPGTRFSPSSFWHLVFGVPDEASAQTVISTAQSRWAGWVYAGAGGQEQAWSTTPPWGFESETSYAYGLSGDSPCTNQQEQINEQATRHASPPLRKFVR